jgi:hemolysin III
LSRSSTPAEELANALTHGLGVVASVAGCAILVTLGALRGSAWHVVSSAIFGATLILLYTASTLYHYVRRERAKARLRVFDHCAIYLLIAGTYTPFTLVGLRGGWGWSLFGVIWGLAVAGVVFKLFFTGRFVRLSTAIYLGMGWIVLIAVVPMVQRLSVPTLAWLVAGGVAYTVGTVFSPERLPFAHAVWHVFVLGGSVSCGRGGHSASAHSDPTTRRDHAAHPRHHAANQGKVRPLLEKFRAMAKIGEQKGWGKMRIMTDVSAERFWTLVTEFEVPNLETFMSMGQDADSMKEFEEITKGYHDLVDQGRREIYNIEY